MPDVQMGDQPRVQLDFVRKILPNPVFNLSTDLRCDLAGVIGLALGYKPIVVIGTRVAFASQGV